MAPRGVVVRSLRKRTAAGHGELTTVHVFPSEFHPFRQPRLLRATRRAKAALQVLCSSF